jgi:ribosomal protein S18 acetylase RimI-like enzyme
MPPSVITCNLLVESLISPHPNQLLNRMNIAIREASAEDIPAIVRVRRDAFTDEEAQGFTPPKSNIFCSSEELRKAWAQKDMWKDGWKVAVAEKSRIIAGFIVFKAGHGCCYIDNLNVARERQREGIGRALVAYTENVAKSKGCSLMKTDTTENAEGTPWKSYAFWTRMGYKDTGERHPTKWSFKTIPFEKSLK